MESQHRNPKRIRRENVRGGDGHEDGGLIHLPTEILHTIMLRVSSNLRDHFNAVAGIRTLRRIADDEVYLRDIDLFAMEYPDINSESITNFLIRCRHRGNISALFLQGCSEFFYRHDLENGLAMIRESAMSGYELGIYVYDNLRRILTPTLQVDLELLNPNRDLVRRMRRTLESSSRYYWGPDQMPQLYLERCASFDSSIIRSCHCAWNNAWGRQWDEDVKDPWMCDMCFYAIHVLGFMREIPRRVMQWPMEYNF